MAETVTVSGQAAAVEVTSSTMSQTIENKRMVDLPLNGRNPFSLATLAPGVTPTSNNGGSSPSISGGRNATSEVAIDGVSNVNAENNVSILDLNYTPSVDAVQEFSVQTNAVSAEFGRLGGGVINLITKSGSNALRATAWEFARNAKMDATNFFTNRGGGKKGDFKRNQFGGNLGGPINKDKTFFFVELRRAAPGERQRADLHGAASGVAQRRLLELPQRLGPADHHLRSADDAARPGQPGTVHPRSVPGQRHPAEPHQPDGARDDGLLAAAEHARRPTSSRRPTTSRRRASAESQGDRIDSRVDHVVQRPVAHVRPLLVLGRGRACRSTASATPASSAGGDGPTYTKTHSLSVDHNYTLGPTWVLNVRYGLNRRSRRSPAALGRLRPGQPRASRRT